PVKPEVCILLGVKFSESAAGAGASFASPRRRGIPVARQARPAQDLPGGRNAAPPWSPGRSRPQQGSRLLKIRRSDAEEYNWSRSKRLGTSFLKNPRKTSRPFHHADPSHRIAVQRQPRPALSG